MEANAAAPKVLYHYTDAAGLLGIVRDRKIWLTDFRYMNDAMEFRHGMGMATSILDQLVLSNSSYWDQRRDGADLDIILNHNPTRKILLRLRDQIQLLHIIGRPFLFCLSGRQDDLNQ